MALLSSPFALIQSTPPVTKAYTGAIIISSAVYGWCWWRGLASDAAYYMTMIPGSCLFTPWVFLTSALLEASILGFIFSIIFIPPSLRYLERLWGSIETLKFIVVTIVFSNLITFAVNWIEYLLFGKPELFLFGMKYHGQMAMHIGVLVAFTQIIPEYHVQVMGVLRARVKTLPMAYLGLSTVMCIIGFQCPWIIIQFGWFVSWIYLRFYKKHASDISGTTYGDRSETFSLVSWFPPFVHYPLSILGDKVYSLATRLRLIPKSYGDIEANGYTQVPGGARAEAERRRALALKALDQRVANTSSPVGSSSTNPRSYQAPNLSTSESGLSQSSSQNGSTSSQEVDIAESKSKSKVSS
ncbi:hypothetical protein CC1G_01838 [Coprinopsis cinerea okayama7|uniref:Eukaryotic integral membrane protein n=1 Tax=Coprinopsis cinerea (strain Okayama-7 / 130 / ATCC MYA-4618 / FGSC 9003) TaxID=240176 RepID=A8N2T6_COPC7|nr:hypothetical protein CC1G_01838 [Coprinopsis cinerea okayama7\|eukprot:XP_001829158.2 hypothetical protein CC1G_01838 [Coprinopsis cinerea okayama7\